MLNRTIPSIFARTLLVLACPVACVWLAAAAFGQAPATVVGPANGVAPTTAAGASKAAASKPPVAVGFAPGAAIAPATAAMPPILFKVRGANERLEMLVHSSRLLTLEMKIPRAQVSNPDLLDLTPISANQLQIYAKKTGVTQVNVWDERGEIHAIDVVISHDPRELQLVLQALYPTSTIKVFPTATGVALNGYVDRADQVSKITSVAQDYYPKVINNITVGGAQQVVLYVKVMEISRSKLRTLGIDWGQFSSGDFVTSTIGGLITKGTTSASLSRTPASFTTTGAETIQFGVLHQNASFLGFIQALQSNALVKILAEPTLVAVSGRPAYFMDGGKIPYPVVSGLGSVNVAFQDYGTQVDFVPIILGNGNVRLEVRPSVSEPDTSLGVTFNGVTVPAFTTRTVDTGVEMKMGQTLALAGLIQQRIESTRNSIPVLGDLPFVGALFRRMTDNVNEVELLILVRPELAEAMDCDQVPATGPGENTEPPNDYNFYINGQIEQPPQAKGAPPDRSGGVNALSPNGSNGFGAGGSIAGPAGGGMMGSMMAPPPGGSFPPSGLFAPPPNSTPGLFAPPPNPAPSAPRTEPVPPGTPTIGPANELPNPTLGAPTSAAPGSTRISPTTGASPRSVAGRPSAIGGATRERAGLSASPTAAPGPTSRKNSPPLASTGAYNPSPANNQQNPPKKSDGELPGFIGSNGYDVSN